MTKKLLVLLGLMLYIPIIPQIIEAQVSDKQAPTSQNKKVLGNINEAFFNGNYYIKIQFNAIPTVSQKRLLKDAGITLGPYLGDASYTLVVSESKLETLQNIAFVKSLSAISKESKLDPFIKEKHPNWNEIELDVVLQIFPQTNIEEAILTLQSKGFQISWKHSSMGNIGLRLHGSRLPYLSQQAIVYWIEAKAPENESYNLPGTTLHRASLLHIGMPMGRGLSGKDVIIGEWDGAGLGKHIDLDTRVTNVEPFVAGTGGDHATHVAGTVNGGGNLNPYTRGMAPNSYIYAWNFSGNVITEMDTSIGIYNFVITQNSYGYTPAGDPCTVRGRYDINSYGLDVMVNKHPHLLHVYANGNSRSSNCIAGGYRTVSSGYQSAKNVLTVGAVTDGDANSTFHSYGPALDGRIKPDVSAMGVAVFSTMPNNGYSSMNGTSMACPGTSGTAALLYEYYRKLNNNQNPYFHTLKAAICNTAMDLGRPGPDFMYGYGRIDGDKAAQVLENNWYEIDSVDHQDHYVKNFNVLSTDSLAELKIFLCWQDVPALGSTGTAIVNDLDLFVVNPIGDTIRPLVPDFTNVTANAIQRIDTLNTNEQIVIKNVMPGNYEIIVSGSRVPSGPSPFTITWLPVKEFLKISFPIGGEKWYAPSDAGRARRILWDSYGLKGKLKVEFSPDSGQTWTLLANNLDSNIQSYLWNNAPTTLMTDSALIKISTTTGDHISVTPARFTIMGNHANSGPNAIICSERITLTWPQNSNYAAAKVYQLINGEMQSIGVTKDTFFVVNNLIDGQEYWFAIAALNNNNSEGIRSLAKMYVPGGTNKGPSITLQPLSDSLCAGNTAFFYSEATAIPDPQSRWEWSLDGGLNWDTLPFQHADSFVISTIRSNQNNLLYRNAYYNLCGGFAYTDTVEWVVDSTVVFDVSPASFIACEGQSIQMGVAPTSIHYMYWNWELSEDSLQNWHTITGTDSMYTYTFDSILYNQTGHYYRVVAHNLCGTFYSDSAYGIVRPPLSISVSEDTLLCTGQQVKLFVNKNGGDTAAIEVTWEYSLETTDSITVDPTSSMYYVVRVNDFCSVGPLFDSVWVGRREPLTFQMLSNDTTICVGSATEIRALISGGVPEQYTVFWLHDLSQAHVSGTDTIIPQIERNWGFVVTDYCSAETPGDSIYVDFLPPLQVQTQPIDSICFGQFTSLEAMGTGGRNSTYVFTWIEEAKTGDTIQVNPAVSQTYRVILADGCTVKEDTTAISVLVREPLNIQINHPSEVCLGDFAFVSIATSGGVTAQHNVDFTPLIGAGFDFQFIPSQTEKYFVTLTDACSESITDSFDIIVNPLPQLQVAILPNPVCQNRIFNVNWTGWANGGVNTTLWEIDGKNVAQQTENFAYSITNPGLHDLKLSISDAKNCSKDSTWQIDVRALPFPNFTYSPQEITIEDPHVVFTSTSQNSVALDWNFGNAWTSGNLTERVTYNDTGFYTVRLTAYNELGCDSTVQKTILIKDIFKLFVPTAFSPNDNLLNDVWLPVTRAVQTYELKVFNRWGEKIFETTNPMQGWDGSYMNQGNVLQEGIYMYTLRIIDKFGELHTDKGSIILIK